MCGERQFRQGGWTLGGIDLSAGEPADPGTRPFLSDDVCSDEMLVSLGELAILPEKISHYLLAPGSTGPALPTTAQRG